MKWEECNNEKGSVCSNVGDGGGRECSGRFGELGAECRVGDALDRLYRRCGRDRCRRSGHRGVDIQIAFNGALVEAYSVWDPEMEEYSVLPATEGQFIRKAGGPILEFLGWGDGYLSYTVTRLGTKSSTGSGTAATLTFLCLAPGQTALSYLVQGTDLTGEIIMSGSGVVNVDQGGGGVVPEPMTLALVGVALTALGLVARKRS